MNVRPSALSLQFCLSGCHCICRVLVSDSNCYLFVFVSLFICQSVCRSVLSFCLSLCWFVCLFICFFVSPSVCHFICHSVCFSVSLFVGLSVCLSGCQAIYVPAILFVCQSYGLFVCLSVCLSVFKNFCLLLHLSSFLSVIPTVICLFLFLFLSVSLSVCWLLLSSVYLCAGSSVHLFALMSVRLNISFYVYQSVCLSVRLLFISVFIGLFVVTRFVDVAKQIIYSSP